jgi:hypothetical protein
VKNVEFKRQAINFACPQTMPRDSPPTFEGIRKKETLPNDRPEKTGVKIDEEENRFF